MLTSHDLLRSYARLLHRLSGAEAVSLYLPGSPEVPGSPRLIHHDSRPAVPELADAAAAGELLHAAEAELDDPTSPLPRPSRRRRAPVSSRHRRAPVSLRSGAPGGRLIRVPAGPRLPEPGPAAAGRDVKRRRKVDRRGAPEKPPALWIGLELAAGAGGETSFAGDDEALWRRALAHGADLAGYCRRVDGVVRDPVTGLPGRADFQAALRREVGLAIEGPEPLALLLANPDDFHTVNERFGSQAGDAVAREIARRLEGALRGTDRVHRYGGVVFAGLLPATARADAVAVAGKLHGSLTAEGYLDGAVRLGFSFGIADLEAAAGRDVDDAAWTLVERADRSLSQAKLASSGRVVAWRPGSGGEVVVHRDRLAGIFTADLAKDYRNMLLLWDTVEIMTAAADPGELTARAVERLAATFKPERAGLLRWAEGADPELVAGHGVRGGGSRRPGELVLADAERLLVERARAEAELVSGRLPAAAGGEADSAYAVPLLARGECLGCLYLAGRAGALRLDASDLLLLKAVAGQLAAALDRAELAARESARLRAELEALRTGLGENQIVHRSPRMAALMATARRVAPTDATVLVTGASGTGKELVARMVHALSPRRGKPAVVVDCGAISASLIDSELFGHEKGAYTGAAGRTAGRLAEAAGSTVILDEIGELPLEVQSKLLRFVQEREIIAVGGTRPRTVDARLVAVTHRDLADEVAAGRFREDLYYRLNVIHLEVPALVERPEDVPILIDHFARRFAARYCKDVRGLSPEAAALAARYPWPGNVRELENRILQAVILSEGEEIGPEDLELDVAAARAAGARPAGAETMDLDLGGVEKRHIERVLASEGSSMARAARRLGIHRSTLYEKVRKYGIERPD